MASARDRPVLRRDLVIARVVRGGVPFTVVKDPVSGRTFDFGYLEGRALRLIDGRRTLDQVGRALGREVPGTEIAPGTLEAFADALSRLNLLDVGRRALDEAALDRGRRRAEDGRLGLGSIFYAKRSLGDPSPLVERLLPLGRLLFAPPFVVLALAFVALGIVVAAAEGPRFLAAARAPFGGGAAPGLLVAAYGIAVAGVALHELGHALACRRYGGRVDDAGVIAIFGMPCLYCDVSDAWLFPRRSSRIVVTLAGCYVQAITAAAAVLVFALAPPGSAIGEVAAAYALASGGVALLLNLNPLVKFDGYYLVVDLLDQPNLEARAFEETGRLLGRLLGREAPPPERPLAPARRAALVAFAVAAVAYRVTLLAGLAAVAVGLAGASAAGFAALGAIPLLAYRARRRVLGLARALRPLGTPTAAGRRRALAVAAAAAAVAALLLIADPVVSRFDAVEATVEPLAVARVRAPVNGRPGGLPARGARVRAGDPVGHVVAGDRRFVLEAPASGFVGYVTDEVEVRRGETVLRIDSDSALVVELSATGAEGLAAVAPGDAELRLRSRPGGPGRVRVAPAPPGAGPPGSLRVELGTPPLGAAPLAGERAVLRFARERRFRDLLGAPGR